MKGKRPLTTLAAVALMALAMLAAFSPEAVAANPSTTQSGGSAGQGQSALSVSLTSVTAGDAIIVFEWIGTASNPCSYLLFPTDSLGNTFRSFTCVPDGANGALEAFFVQNSGPGADAVTCNFAVNAILIESCYVFDVANPGTISLLATATGLGTSAGTTFTALSGALILNTIGVQLNCGTPTIVSTVNPLPVVYTPPNECFTYSISDGRNGVTYYSTGLTGSSHSSNGGADGWTMTLSNTATWSEEVVQVAATAAASSSTSTSFSATITGWLAPDAAHISASIPLLVFPLAGLVVGVTMARFFGMTGDIGVYFALGGLTIGSLLADVPTGTSNTLLIPFGYTVVAGMLTFLYWWDS